MALPTASDNVFSKLLVSEQTAPGTPVASTAVLYLDVADGLLKWKDDAGTAFAIGSAPANIEDYTTAETDDTLVLAPDGVGGVEFRAEAGGGGSTAYATSIPRMTAASTPSGTASASTELGAGSEAWRAMAAPGTSNGWLSNGSALPQWIKYQYSGAKTAVAYGFRPWWVDNYPGRTPTAWTFEGSNDDSSWTTLDTVSGFSPNSSSVDFVFSIASPASYAYYRLNISANGGNAYVGVGEFLIFTSEDPISGGVLVQRNDLSAAIAS